MSESYISVTEGSGKNVSSVQATINSTNVQIERAIQGMGVITLPSTPQLDAVSATGHYPSVSYIDVQGRFYIICKNTFNDNTAIAKYRIAFYDTADALIGYTNEITISNLAILDGSRYIGTNVVYSNDFGAKSIKIYVTSLSASDTISVYVGVT
jgi:hypothetical protein